MSNEIVTNPAVQALQTEWIKAKDAENQWKNYRLSMEEQIVTTLVQLGYDFPEKGKLLLEQLEMAFKLTRTWDQPTLGQVIVHNPSLLQTSFKVVYSPISNPAIDKMLLHPSAIAAELAGCFTDKPAKVSFTIRK